MGMSVVPSDNYESIADDLLSWYDEVKDWEINKDGMIIKEAN